MSKIGFQWGWDSWSSTESKWEKSLFGGFHRLVTDYPRVVVDWDVDFDFAPIKNLTYLQKEKILKIFLSKAKNRDQINLLLKNAITTKESSFIHGNVIKTTINKFDKESVLNNLISFEKEYAPLFEHYEEFIINSDISFKRPDKNSGSGESEDENENDENKDGEQKKGKKQTKQSPKSALGHHDNPSDDNILNNLIEFEKALRDIKEEEIKFNNVSTFSKKVKIEIQKNDRETLFSKEEILIADNLTKMLDISFDPTSDTVKNLRLGKLDISKIAEVPAGNVAIYKQTVENQTTKPFSVVILCDESGSMKWNGRIAHQYHVVKSLYKSFSDILPQDKIFVYGHSGECSPELYIYHDLYNPNFLTTIDNMLNRYYQENYDGPVIEEVYKNVRSVTNDRIIFIVLSDGNPAGQDYGGMHDTDPDIVNMKQIIEKCKRDDFVTVGIGIETHHVRGLYQYSAIVEHLNEMPKKVSHIVNHVVKTEFQ